jgi:hypothetical protein
MTKENNQLFAIGESAVHASPLTQGVTGVGVGLAGGALTALARGFWFGLPAQASFALVPKASLNAAGVIGLFWTVRTSFARFRQTDDALNTMAGGVSVGILSGLATKSLSRSAWAALSYGLGLAAFETMMLSFEEFTKKNIEEHEAEEKSLWKFKGYRKDPFEARWEDMKARHAQKNSLE